MCRSTSDLSLLVWMQFFQEPRITLTCHSACQNMSICSRLPTYVKICSYVVCCQHMDGSRNFNLHWGVHRDVSGPVSFVGPVSIVEPSTDPPHRGPIRLNPPQRSDTVTLCGPPQLWLMRYRKNRSICVPFQRPSGPSSGSTSSVRICIFLSKYLWHTPRMSPYLSKGFVSRCLTTTSSRNTYDTDSTNHHRRSCVELFYKKKEKQKYGFPTSGSQETSRWHQKNVFLGDHFSGSL